MKRFTFWFDPISPFAYLAFERLPQALEGIGYVVDYRPVLFAALLRHHASKGPAEIEPKRAWTFRHVHWIAAQQGIALDTPLLHPFNPLPLLRLALAAGTAGADGLRLPNRRVVEALFRHVWRGGTDASDPARLAALQTEVAPLRDPASPEVKAELKMHTDAAIESGVFGVPSYGLAGRVLWGLDALPMLAAALRGDAWFDGPAWEREGSKRPGIVRG